jgi:diaminopimelate epimerase
MKETAAPRAFTKMQGTGNSFFIVDGRIVERADYADLARELCSAPGDAGADGLLVIVRAHKAQAGMRVFNADGSEAEMCGNGVRCLARYLCEEGGGDVFAVATAAGPISLRVVQREPVFRVRAELDRVGFPNDARAETIEAAGSQWTYHSVNVGNPHIVIFVADVDAVDLPNVGPALATHTRFPRGTNVHFVAGRPDGTLLVRHWERGAGATLSCGTGAVACAAAAIRLYGARSPVTVAVPGGELDVEWRPGAPAALTGPAEFVSK